MFATLFPILGITFIDILGFSILIPIMPYYVEHFGASKVVVGVLFSTFAACQFIAAPLWGHLSDRIGRKAVLIVSQIGATIGWTMLAFSPSIAWVFAARIVEGASGGNISVTQAYVSDRVPPEQRARAFAWVGVAFSCGIVLGPAAGALLLGRYGYTVAFLLAAALQVVTLVTTIAFLPEEVAAKGETSEAVSLHEMLRAAFVPVLRPLLAQKLAYSLGLYAWFAVFALVLQAQLGFGVVQTSYFFAAFGVLSIVFQLGVVGRLSDRIGVRAASNVGFTSMLAFFAIVPFARDLTAFAWTMPLFGLGMALSNATLPALLTDAAPETMRGSILGIGSSLESISGIVMPTIATGVLALYGTPWTTSICAAFVCVALALGISAQRRTALGLPKPAEAD